jgi:TolB-like protein
MNTYSIPKENGMSYTRAVILFSLFLLLFSGLAVPSMAAQTAAGDTATARVAVLPFAMNTPANLNYLQGGIRDMLSSRLSWQTKVQVVNKSEADRAIRGEKEISQSEALRIGAGLKADYVLYGSITSTGQSVSIEAKMVPVSGKTEPVSFYAQTKTLDDIMPQVNLLAQQINQKVFGKPEETAQAASTEAEALATRDPELLLQDAKASGGKQAPDEKETVPIQAGNPPEQTTSKKKPNQ